MTFQFYGVQQITHVFNNPMFLIENIFTSVKKINKNVKANINSLFKNINQQTQLFVLWHVKWYDKSNH